MNNASVASPSPKNTSALPLPRRKTSLRSFAIIVAIVVIILLFLEWLFFKHVPSSTISSKDSLRIATSSKKDAFLNKKSRYNHYSLHILVPVRDRNRQVAEFSTYLIDYIENIDPFKDYLTLENIIIVEQLDDRLFNKGLPPFFLCKSHASFLCSLSR